MKPSPLFLSLAVTVTVAVATGLVGTHDANAQTTTTTGTTTATGGATVGLTSGAIVTHTLPNGDDFTRDATLNPAGINFEDCERDIVLNFPLTVSGATLGTDVLVAYAGQGCDTYTNRNLNSGNTTCWRVVPDQISYNINAGFTQQIRAREILSQAQPGTTKGGYKAIAANDDSVCYIQGGSAPLSLNVYFVFTDTGQTQDLGSGSATINADLAAGVPPSGLSIGIGDTILLPTWTAVIDTDIVGFNVYYAKATTQAPVTTVTICPDGSVGVDSSSTETEVVDDGGDADVDSDGAAIGVDSSTDGAATDGAIDSSTTTPTTSDAAASSGTGACFTQTIINATPVADGGGIPYEPSGYACTSPFPAGKSEDGTATVFSDGGDESGVATSTGATTFSDDASNTTTTTEDGATVSTGGSISPLSLQPRSTQTYQFISVAGNTSTGTTISGLTDGVAYAVAVASTDAYGNVGALSSSTGTTQCQYPQPVTDFWETYKDDGGGAGGGFCSLEAPGFPTGAGGSAIVTLAALVFAVRRRRR